ncbi:TIGR03757 family integrating conjugative element protein [Pseudomonas chlororaphis subsp. piscium]|uniref:DUF1525 domain-containing protein n=1 Tax=Pseudomonas chlororaphis TaxID=587753 RepID=UPI000F56692E|nr:DUF1525 domain-containing protein [Pseudomonas chlororaphis]UQS88739.1 TIGR03757 family integrating conjugative element protein [Pseudomonas chlororaphis subsp. piscium]
MTQLDAGLRLEDELAAALPADPEQATGVAQHRLEQGGAALQRRLAMPKRRQTHQRCHRCDISERYLAAFGYWGILGPELLIELIEITCLS